MSVPLNGWIVVIVQKPKPPQADKCFQTDTVAAAGTATPIQAILDMKSSKQFNKDIDRLLRW